MDIKAEEISKIIREQIGSYTVNVDVAEVGSTGVFLASDASSGITGEVIYVDCGYNIMGF